MKIHDFANIGCFLLRLMTENLKTCNFIGFRGFQKCLDHLVFKGGALPQPNLYPTQRKKWRIRRIYKKINSNLAMVEQRAWHQETLIFTKENRFESDKTNC